MYHRISILGMTLPAYGVITILGALFVSIVGIITAWHRKLSVETFLKLECVGGISAIIGAKVWDMITNAIEKKDYLFTMDSFMKKGLSFYGGLFFGALSVWIASKILHADYNNYARNLIFLVPLLHGIWKIGCFMGGCCYGIPYHGLGSVTFPEGVKAPAGIALFPVQIVEAGILFAMTLACYVKGRKQQWRHPVLEYMGSYAVGRFLVEFFRWHENKEVISIAQIVSLVCACTVALIFYMEKRERE